MSFRDPEPTSNPLSRAAEGFRIFTFSGIEVRLHWMWFLVAAWQMDQRKGVYQSPLWMVCEYLGLFLLVLLHEFGHAFACRQTGGSANRILLWPLGGVAYVSAPQRPGAQLWTIAAGPLVNLALIPVLWILGSVLFSMGLLEMHPDAWRFLRTLTFINIVLLVFNMLPIFPLDGGQILRSVLWFFIGPLKSLKVASIVGLFGGACLVGYALWTMSIWTGVLAFYALSQSWSAFQAVRSAETRP